MPWIERVRTGQPLDAGIGIDRDNPITQGLAFALLRFEDAVSGGLATPNGTSLVPSRGGVGVKAAASSSLGASFSKSRLSSKNGAGTGDFSVLVGASPIASTTRELMFCSCNGTTEFYIAANANVGLTASSGSISPQTNIGGASGVSQSGGANGQPRIWLYTRIGIVGTLYCDGAVVSTGAVSQAQMWSSASTINVGGYSGANWGVSSSVFAAAGWNRGLSEAEAKLLTGDLQNPWQLFEKERIFVPLTTGGDTAAITQADGTSTAGTLGGAASAASTPTAADGVSTAASITASAVAAAGVTSADGTSIASALAGSAVNAAAITQADGVSTAATLTGTGLADGAAGITPAAGTSTTETLAGSSAAVSSFESAAGASAVSVLGGASLWEGAFSAAAGVSTCSSLVGSDATIVITPGYPDPSTVLVGISYGPTGVEYTGTFTVPSAASIAVQVRTELAAELLRITEVAKIHGLVQGTDLVVTPTSRVAGDIAQTISGDGVSSSTVSRV